MSLPFHPLAEIFPAMSAGELAELVADMRENGFRVGEEIVLIRLDADERARLGAASDWAILDGRHRYLAAVEAGIFPADVDPETRWEFIHFDTEGINGLFTDADVAKGPLAFVISRNLHRRHLSDRQRVSVAAKIANLRRGRPADTAAEVGENPPIGGISAEEAAATLNVAPRQVERARVVHEQGVPELREALDRGDIAVSAAERVARLPEPAQHEEVARLLPNAARAIAPTRREPDDSLDFFPTPPFATRALLERVLPHLGVSKIESAWDPAGGEGHIAEVLREYCPAVHASDLFDYGYRVPGQSLVPVGDFLAHGPATAPIDDWIITNPPFGDLALRFVVHALSLAPNVAMFFRSQWAVEGIERWDTVFRDRPPTLCAFFVERVPLAKGRFDPEGSTLTAYCWLVWQRGESARPPFWIPPGCRDVLTRADDAERFTTHPVTSAPMGVTGPWPLDQSECTSLSNRDASAGGEPSSGAGPQAEAPHAGTGTETPADRERHSEGEPDRRNPGPGPGPAPRPVPSDDDLDIPDFLRRRLTPPSHPSRPPLGERRRSAAELERDARAAIAPRNLTAAVLGDPLPGCSALDRWSGPWRPNASISIKREDK
jgi:hypothetical protein